MLRRLAALTLALLLLAPGALATNYPVTVVDDLGRDVTLTAVPERVVSMLPSHTESVCAVGACAALVGVDTYSNYPASVTGLPTLGDAFGPDLEAIVALEPDFVLVDEYSGLQAPLEALGIAVYAGSPQTIAETYDFLTTLGTLLDRETEAAVLVGRLQGELAGVASVLAGVNGPTVFVELDPTPYSVGPGSYLDELVAAAGGVNVVTAAMGPFPQVDPEYVVLQDPAFILLTDAPFGVTAADVAARPGWGGLTAVVSGRVVEIDQETADVLSRSGPRLGEAVRRLAAIFHPGMF
ncbi:MAG: ABC transporter substrate-binding protein [Trueperaceae bacterium]|nr:ABC transporter substrate-binding protein [Trueperaceae bacterium]MCO5173974.1 helical backbone metal receptor [Trueperaceae bacterium]MCW5819214.1 ABC transporter substrate-binding protein [Trueperaceae bacterium]